MNFPGNGCDNEPAYKVPVGCKDQSEVLEDTSTSKNAQPYEITRVQHSDHDLRRLSSKYIQLNNESKSKNFEVHKINCPEENDYYHIYENGDIYSIRDAGDFNIILQHVTCGSVLDYC